MIVPLKNVSDEWIKSRKGKIKISYERVTKYLSNLTKSTH